MLLVYTVISREFVQNVGIQAFQTLTLKIVMKEFRGLGPKLCIVMLIQFENLIVIKNLLRRTLVIMQTENSFVFFFMYFIHLAIYYTLKKKEVLNQFCKTEILQ